MSLKLSLSVAFTGLAIIGLGLTLEARAFILTLSCLLGSALVWVAAWKRRPHRSQGLKDSDLHESPKKEQDEHSALWDLFANINETSYLLAALRLSEWLGETDPQDPSQIAKRHWANDFRSLMELKLILDSESLLRGRLKLQQLLCFQRQSSQAKKELEGVDWEILQPQEILHASLCLSELLRKVHKISQTQQGRLATEAHVLLERILGKEGTETIAFQLQKLTDRLQDHFGIPFLLFNLIHCGKTQEAKDFAQVFSHFEESLDEDLKRPLYWIAELEWFLKAHAHEPLDSESAVKYLYHLCFTSPDRVGFMEIDSPFISDLQAINEIAEEGFLVKEGLIEEILQVWSRYEGWFEPLFHRILNAMLGKQNKIYSERANWERWLESQRGQMDREHFYVIEGNLYYASQRYQDAAFCYEKALKIEPGLRAATFNLLLVSAELKDKKTHERVKQLILGRKDWFPVAFSLMGNSALVLGDEEQAVSWYEKLRQEKGWEHKADFYLSLFCFERRWLEKALHHAIQAHHATPLDSSVSFHLSRCYSAMGEKEAALTIFTKVMDHGEANQANPQLSWLKFYRFTLERDSGKWDEAVKTLMAIPKDYFQDTEELEAALEFARLRKDLSLLRHLKQRAS